MNLTTHTDRKPMHLFTRSGGCGVGKTYATLREIVSTTGYYLVAIETVARFPEVIADLHMHAETLNTNPAITSKASIQPGSDVGQSANVRADIMALPDIWECAETPHVICVITHEALKAIDSSTFGNWTVIVDEVPQIFQMEMLRTEASAAWFDANFDVLPSESGKWSKVILRDGAVTRTKLGRDDRLRDWLPFHSAVSSDRVDVYCNIKAASDMADDRVEWSWWSFWRVEGLRGFRAAIFLGNNFRNSVFARTVDRVSPGTNWEELPVAGDRLFKRRPAIVYCFAQGHRISRSMYQREPDQQGLRDGQQNLVTVGNFLRGNLGPNSIWSCNDAMREFIGILPGEKLTPKQAGSNQFKSATACAMIYSAKASPLLTSIYSELGISADDIAEERELETIIQMATRIAVRDPDSTDPLSYYVYDNVQARHLADYLHGSGYVDVELKVIDLGFAKDRRTPNKSGPKTRVLTPDEAAEKKRRSNDLARLRNIKSRARRAELVPPKVGKQPPTHTADQHDRTTTQGDIA